MSNHLKNETSPYLLQHAENPVDWYPWCDEAFERAAAENKPVFLSIGYSTCHWCHVMARESFSDYKTAEFLNKYFISVKVDREERPDIDSIYMSVCQMLTGAGGWPTSIFMTADRKPFFAGTYFPLTSYDGHIGFYDLLRSIITKWKTDRAAFIMSAEEITAHINYTEPSGGTVNYALIDSAVLQFSKSFDRKYGGFGSAPKFPMPHNLLFLLKHHEKSKDKYSLEMAEKTLSQMYAGGIFDHIGGGFCRYSTDMYFLIPHFEKMLYDNALMIMAYCRAYEITSNTFYLSGAEKTANYILREMTSDTGGFFSAQDADSNGTEGEYYLFEPSEIIDLLGEAEGADFCRRYDITNSGKFNDRSIPNLLKSLSGDSSTDKYLPQVYEYRRKRMSLKTDDKILTSWNSLMLAAMCRLYQADGKEKYLDAAVHAYEYIETNLCDGDSLYVSFRMGKHGKNGFLEDYSFYTFALISLYRATLERNYLDRAIKLCDRACELFFDFKHGGFYLYGAENEQLISRPKDTSDNALPSGNSIMAYNLVHLSMLIGEEHFKNILSSQMSFMSAEAAHYPAGYPVFLCALSDFIEPPEKITVVLPEGAKVPKLPTTISSEAAVTVFYSPTKEYPLKNGSTTFYVCRRNTCLPPVNDLSEIYPSCN